TRPCPTCDGEGVIKSEETIAIEFERRMRDLAAETKAEALLLQMNPRVSAEFTGGGARTLHAIEEATGKWFHFEGSEGLPLEHFAVLMEADREKVLERALPFREGEEVYVELVEPHMYTPGAAVAKIDVYIIAIKDADKYVGEKLLVRIEEVGRTEAVARLVDVPPAKSEAAPAGPSASRARSRRRTPKAAEADAAVEVVADEADDAAVLAASEVAPSPQDDETENVIEELAPVLDDEAENEDRRDRDEDAEDASGDAADGEDGDGVESKPRRRGRRGGRRRSGARAEAASSTSQTSSE